MAVTNGCCDQDKIRILERYRLYPVVHTVLLPGRSLTCCCGQPITGEFYQFDVIDHAGNILNALFASSSCAQNLLRLSQTHGTHPIIPLPLFDPMHHPENTVMDEPDALEHSLPRHPLNTEVENAIYLTLMCRDSPAEQRHFFSQLLGRIRQNPGYPIRDWEIRAMNTAMSKDGKCLTTMLEDQQEKSLGFKRFAFPEMRAALQREAARTGLRIHCNL
jgi:hypothetical protein